MAGKIDQVVVIDLKKDFGRYEKGTHAMNVKVAEKLKKRGADFTQKKAKDVMESLVKEAKNKLSDAEEAQEKANKGK